MTETDDAADDYVDADRMLQLWYGSARPIRIKALSLEVNSSPIPHLVTPVGPVEVSGSVTAYFESGNLADWFRRSERAHENRLLRVMRPHMPKRQWQRLRGRVAARRRRR